VCWLFSFFLAAFFGADLTRFARLFSKTIPGLVSRKQHPEGGVADEL